MNKEYEEYIIDTVGMDIARENLAIKVRKLMENQDDPEFRKKFQKIIEDRDEINKGNKEVIRRYMGEMGNE